jgi:hypothetical protein
MTDPREKAIEAAARARYEAIDIGPWYDLCQEDKDALLGNMRHTIAAYEAAMWRQASECKDGREYVARYINQGNVSKIVKWSNLHECWKSKAEVIPNFEAQSTLLYPLPSLPEGVE